MTDDASRITRRLIRLLEEDRERAQTCLTDRTKPIPPLREVEMIRYPIGSSEHPFDPLAKGRYFIHMASYCWH